MSEICPICKRPMNLLEYTDPADESRRADWKCQDHGYLESIVTDARNREGTALAAYQAGSDLDPRD